MRKMIEAEKRLRKLSALLALEELRAASRGDSRIRIAVLDGPVDRTHPGLAAAHLRFVGKFPISRMPAGPAAEHGTHVASVIFGQPGTSAVLGLAARCSGVILPIYQDSPHGGVTPCSQANLARTILRALDEGAHIINISGGQLEQAGRAQPPLLHAIRECARRGVLVIAAVGNNGCECLHVPGALPSVLAVGAADDSGMPLPSSNWGGPYALQGLLAPGEDIPGALPGNIVGLRSGSSFATAIVSGIAALLLSVRLQSGRAIDPLAVRQALLRSAKKCDPSTSSECHRFLVGHINPAAALSLIEKGEEKMYEAHVPREETLPAQAGSLPVSGSEGDSGGLLQGPVLAEVLPQGLEVSSVPETALVPAGAAASPGSLILFEPGRNDSVLPAGCGCGGGKAPQLIYALGTIGYDFGTRENFDWFYSHMPPPVMVPPGGGPDPYDWAQMSAFLDQNPAYAAALIWTLNQGDVPIYAIHPSGSFGDFVYTLLRQFLKEQVQTESIYNSIPGFESGKVTLMDGRGIPVVRPDPRGMYNWTIPQLVDHALQACKGQQVEEDEVKKHLANLLMRLYEELRNFGRTAQERATNFTGTSAIQLLRALFAEVIKNKLMLSGFEVKPNPLCRVNGDCWDIYMTFFNPEKVLTQAKRVYRFTIDVAGVIPVVLGPARSWETL